MSWFDQFQPHYGSYDEMLNAAQTGGRTISQPTTDYSSIDMNQFLQPYFDRVDVSNPDSINQLVAAMQADGIPVEQQGDLIRLPGHDFGWMDVRKDKAFLEGRRGPESMAWTVQPYYGSEDRDRLLAQGRHPDTGEPMAPGSNLPPGYSFNTGSNPLYSVDAPGLGQPWKHEFTPPSTVGDFNDPGFRARMQAGMDAIQRSAAAKGTLLTGGTLKDLNTFAQDYASNEYDKVYGRRLGEYGMNRDTFFQNKNSLFGQLSNLSSLGQNAAAQTGNYAGSYGANAGNLISSQGDANAASRIASGNAWGGALGNLGNIAQQTYWMNLLNQPQSRQGS